MIASDKWFKDYLEILDLKVKEPDKKYLGELIFSHLTKIPFENIQKFIIKLNTD